MATGSEGTAVRASAASWSIGLIVAFCAVLLLKWLALVALAAVLIFAFVRWARGGWDRAPADRAPVDPRPPHAVEEPGLPAPRPSAHDDCTWCGLRGGHRDDRGRPVRPRHAHA